MELEESDVVVEGLAVVVVVDVGRCNPKHNISSCMLLYVYCILYTAFKKNCTFSNNFHYFATSLSQALLAAIGCTEIGQPIGVSVHSQYVESFQKHNFCGKSFKKHILR